MSKLEEFAKIVQIKDEMYKELIRSDGPFRMGPTRRGGMWLTLNEKQLFTDVSIKDLKSMRDLIDCFLKEVAS